MSPAQRQAELRHELGNRLAAIVAFSHLIRTDPRLPDDLHDQASLLIEEAGRTRQLVDELLDRSAGVDGLSPRRTTTPAVASTAAASGGPAPRRILVVDDEPAIRDFLGRMLRRLGYEPLVAADGDEALAIVRSNPPDAILSDHRMAGLTGPAFLDEVAAASPALARRFAFMSGDPGNEELRTLAERRGVALLSKPFDIPDVEAVLARILEA